MENEMEEKYNILLGQITDNGEGIKESLAGRCSSAVCCEEIKNKNRNFLVGLSLWALGLKKWLEKKGVTGAKLKQKRAVVSEMLWSKFWMKIVEEKDKSLPTLDDTA
ncbi:hypothetical protein Fot_42704 [Forsythia ovata]|uniref:Uncharacterized protein n=1 Tax=Forsythia ovata TaxID=205694 RepID=A0ABD1RNH2_9LAMI